MFQRLQINIGLVLQHTYVSYCYLRQFIDNYSIRVIIVYFLAYIINIDDLLIYNSLYQSSYLYAFNHLRGRNIHIIIIYKKKP